jgi:DNA-binding NarL/FixJ family response regulator
MKGAWMNILVNLCSHLLGSALCALLTGEPEIGRAHTPTDLSPDEEFHPDFVLTDSHTLRKGIPLDEGGAAKVVLIDNGLGEEEIASLLLMYKIDGVLSTTSGLAHLKKALTAITGGQVWLDNRKVKALIHHAEPARASTLCEGFSRKEREIIVLISQGFMNREIADKLCISEQTVKTHISRIFRKANVARRSQLVPLALKFTVSGAL